MSGALFLGDWSEKVKHKQITCGTTYTKIDLEGASRIFISPATVETIFLVGPSDAEGVTVGIPFGYAAFGSPSANYSFEGPTSIGLKVIGDGPSVWVVGQSAGDKVNVTLFYDDVPLGANLLGGNGAAVAADDEETREQEEQRDTALQLFSGEPSSLF